MKTLQEKIVKMLRTDTMCVSGMYGNGTEMYDFKTEVRTKT